MLKYRASRSFSKNEPGIIEHVAVSDIFADIFRTMLQKLFRLSNNIKKNVVPQQPHIPIPFPVPTSSKQDDIMVALALSRSLGVADIESGNLGTLENFDSKNDDECLICFGNMFERRAYMLQCCHMFCRECIARHISTKLDNDICNIICPLCPESVQEEDSRFVRRTNRQ